VRRRGLSPEAAEDLTQDFFARLLEKQSLSQVDPTKGKFRSFLLASLKNFLANEYDKSQTRKRGGQSTVIAIDSLSAEARYAMEPVDTITPERVFEQRWAWAVLDRVLQLLREKYEAEGQGPLFDAIKGTLTGRAETGDHAQIALKFNMQTGTIAVATHRLRRRYRQLLRDEIAHTVADPEHIDEELQYLLNCL
jgi:RNA polymerase sigma-70 factor (ECF subfamily)